MAHVEDILKKLLKKIAEDKEYDREKIAIKAISSGGANYTSALFLATLSSPNKDDLEMFAKVALIGENMRAMSPMKMYDAERFFYTELMAIYKKLEAEHEVPEDDRLLTPIFYGCNDTLYEETIVLENLAARGFKDHNRFVSIEWDYAASAIEELAKFHALSLAYKQQDPEGYERVNETYKFSMDMTGEHLEAFMNNVIGTALKNAEDEYKDRLKTFLETMSSETFVDFYKPLRCAVIVHGDYRPSNLMHKVHDNGHYEVIPVDYQTFNCGSPVNDLLYFIFSGSDEEFRGKHYQQLVDHYYTHLSRAMTRLGVDPEATYPREDFDLDLKEKLPFGLSIAVFLLPLVTVEAEDAPIVSEDMDLSSFNIEKTGASFTDRLNGILRDFDRWGIL